MYPQPSRTLYRDMLLFGKGGSSVIAQINSLCLCCVAFKLDQVILASRGGCACSNINGYDKDGVGGYLYRDLGLTSFEIGLKVM